MVIVQKIRYIQHSRPCCIRYTTTRQLYIYIYIYIQIYTGSQKELITHGADDNIIPKPQK